MKIFNWIVGSFCRTLGRFLFYIAIGILVMLVLNGKVHAETFNVNPHVSIGGYTVPTYWGLDANKTTNLLIKLEDWQLYSQTYNANFGYFEVCANFPVKFNNNNADCSDGCFAREFNTYNTGASCTIYDTSYSGTKYYVFFNIKEYGFKNADTLPIVYDTFSFNNPYNYSVYFSLDNTYLSNEDLYLDFADQIKNEQLLQGTNDKLDTQIGQNETIIDQNQDIINNQDKTNEELENLNDNLTSTDGANLGALQNSAGWLPAGPVDSILNLPLSLLNNLTTNLNKNCQPVILPIPYVNKDLTLPCVNTLYNDMGISSWVTTIGVIASAFIMFSYLLKLYRWVDDTLSFRENNQIDNWGGI